MSASQYTSTPRTSSATETMTLTDRTQTYSSAKMADYEHFDDDEKTLSDLTMDDSSSAKSKKRRALSGAMAHLKTKLGAGATAAASESESEAGKKSKHKASPRISPGYYPTTLQTFEALAASRI